MLNVQNDNIQTAYVDTPLYVGIGTIEYLYYVPTSIITKQYKGKAWFINLWVQYNLRFWAPKLSIPIFFNAKKIHA